MDVLLEFAEKLRLIVWSMTAEGNKPAETVEKETDLTASVPFHSKKCTMSCCDRQENGTQIP